MKCPTCGEHTPDDWKWLHWTDKEIRDSVREVGEDDTEIFGSQRVAPLGAERTWVGIAWMRCGNKACEEPVVVVHQRGATYGGPFPIERKEAWVVYPRIGAERPISPSIPDQYRRDFSEAAGILNRSPRMSAVMSRRILADLLHDYAGLKDWDLDGRVQKFVNDPSRPMDLRQNLEHFRRIGDFGAHTKKNDQDVVIEVDTEEAEWLLDLIERLFDVFILTPLKDAELRARFDKKIGAAGDKPIVPPPADKRK